MKTRRGGINQPSEQCSWGKTRTEMRQATQFVPFLEKVENANPLFLNKLSEVN